MKLRSKRSALHARAELLVPWFANGSLPAEAEPELREHIATCPDCLKDYQEQLRVSKAMRAEGPLVFAAESSYQKLLARMHDPDGSGEPRAMTPASGSSEAIDPIRRTAPVVRWLAAAVILQAFAMGLGAWVWHSSEAARSASYMTLTSAPPSYRSGPRARVVFGAALSVGELQTLLRSIDARIIYGPADGGVYTLGFAHALRSRADLEKRIAVLRANRAVLFAEPIQQGAR